MNQERHVELHDGSSAQCTMEEIPYNTWKTSKMQVSDSAKWEVQCVIQISGGYQWKVQSAILACFLNALLLLYLEKRYQMFQVTN